MDWAETRDLCCPFATAHSKAWRLPFPDPNYQRASCCPPLLAAHRCFLVTACALNFRIIVASVNDDCRLNGKGRMSMKPTIIKVCGVSVLVLLLVFAALGPAKWQLRRGSVGRSTTCRLFRVHVDGLFRLATGVVVGGAITAFAVLLEGLQAFTPDRHPDLQAALYSAAGVLAAAMTADLFTRAPRWLNVRTFLMPQFKLCSPSRMNGWAGLLVAFRRGLSLQAVCSPGGHRNQGQWPANSSQADSVERIRQTL